MGKCKDDPKYNVLSIRVTDKEKATIDEMMRETNKSVSTIIREAMSHYTSCINGSCNPGG